jgi:hypothetical protein
MSDLYAAGAVAVITDFRAFAGFLSAFPIATYCWDGQMKEDEMGGTRSIYWWDKTYVQDFGWNA